VVDEAYIDFAPARDSGAGPSMVRAVREYANLLVMQTFSKSHGLAGIRLGIVQLLNNTKAPYNVSALTACVAMEAMSEKSLALFKQRLCLIAKERSALIQSLLGLAQVNAILGGNDANFVLCQLGLPDPVASERAGFGKGLVPNNTLAHAVYLALAQKEGVVVRFRGKEPGCEGCLRVSVGTSKENQLLLHKLRKVLDVLSLESWCSAQLAQ